MITYPVTPDKRFVVYQISTETVLHPNNTWPRFDGGPIEGADPDIAYLEIKRGPEPEYDPRIFRLQATEGPDVQDEAWNVTYEAIRLEDPLILSRIDDIEAAEIERHVPNNQFRRMVAVNLAAIWRQINSQTLTAKEQSIRGQAIAAGAKLRANADHSDQLKTSILAGQTPDLDAGWEPVE